MKAASAIFERLRLDGFRLTLARKAIIDSLLQTEVPQSVEECVSAVRRGGIGVNKVTVYREVSFLTTQGISAEVDFGDGVKRYEILPEGGHHHHVVCTSCRTVEDVDIEKDLEKIQRRLAAKSGFRIDRHALEFFGTCSSCTR